jgi:acyl-ACP thioesterase
MDIWQEDLPMRFGNIDRSDRLTLWSTFDLFQEAAICHAENLGVGRDALEQARQAWVLARMSVLMERRPKWGEAITVRSWPRGADRLFAVRDYDIRDSSGRAVVRGRSGWLILDIDKRRPLRVQQLVETLPPNEGLNALSGGGGGLEARGDLEKRGERRAAYSDIDYNGHVNNTRYIQWIQDVIDPGALEKADRIRLDINYLSEIKYGEITELWTAGIDASGGIAGGIGAGSEGSDGGADPAFDLAIAVEGRRRDGGKAAFRAELRTGTGV